MAGGPGSRRPGDLASVPFLLLLAVGLGSACASGKPVTGEGGMRSILPDEFAGSSADNVLELVEELRPTWLLSSVLVDPSSPWEESGPGVLLDDLPLQPLFTLQFVPLTGVREVRYLTRQTAELWYRISAPQGIILVRRAAKVGPGGVPPDTGLVG